MIIEEHVSGRIRFRNGAEVTLSDSNVISVSVRSQCCSDGKLEIGGVYAAPLTMTCHISGTNSFSLRGAKITLNSKYDDELDFSPRGVFWITNAARMSGDIYRITAMDNAGWLDTSSMNYSDEQNRIFDSVAKYFESQGTGWNIQDWCRRLTEFTNTLVSRLTGLSDVLSWVNYNSDVNGEYRNQWIYDQNVGKTIYPATFFLSTETGSGNSDCPRDLFRHLAQLAGGFICAGPDGKLTLRQFGQKDLGTARITEKHMEYDSCEIADFQVQVISSSAQSEILNGAADMAIWTAFSDYAALSPFRIEVRSNPFLDGFTAAWIRGDGAATVPNLWTIAHNLFMTDVLFRPFQCRVHKAERFLPGQKIQILPPGGSDFMESIITSVIWNFRGGYTLACAGEDSRTMADALRMSKADKSLKETRSRCAVLEQKIAGLS